MLEKSRRFLPSLEVRAGQMGGGAYQCEVAVKSYQKGDIDAAHFHKLAHEITLIIETLEGSVM